MSLALMIAGGVLHVVGYVWLVFLAYAEAPAAGRAALFIWPIGLLLVLIRWDETVAKPFILAIAGALLYWGGTALRPPEPEPRPDAGSFSLPR